MSRCVGCVAVFVLGSALSPVHAAVPDPAAEADTAVVSRTPEAERRAPDQSFLSYPEWFLVFSPAEYADHLQAHTPSGFPYFAHLAQLWGGYLDATGAIPEGVPTNWAYHGMVWVIGISSTVEYAARAVYEAFVGRITEPTTEGGLSPQDRLAARVARDYELFLRQAAWYDFDFAGPLRELWTEVPLAEGMVLRGLERRYALTTEWSFKALYAWPLRAMSQASFDAAEFSSTTTVVLDHLPPGAPPPDVVVTARFDDGAVLAVLPRYQAFSPVALDLARRGVGFVEIAGNTGGVLVSLLLPSGRALPGRVLRRDALFTRPGHERVVLVVTVPELGPLLAGLGDPAELEHVFDY
jgi:hypothetical protein